MIVMKLGSLFDGIGGFPLAATRQGIVPVWASEIEKQPINITKKHFPEMEHIGCINEIDGAKVEPVDVITGGSPCQDLSVAGRGAGLAGERSGLFHEQIRIIKEMREATDGKYPRFFVWENVLGAFSSNKGDDFQEVIRQFARAAEVGAAIPRLEGRQSQKSAGAVMGDSWSIAWRVLDAQYWGVPQRRRRIFLVADFRGHSAGKVLFEREGLHGHSETGKDAKQGAAINAEACVNISGGDVAGTLDASYYKGVGSRGGIEREIAAIIINDQGGQSINVERDEISPTLRAQNHGNHPIVAYSFDSVNSNSMKSANPHSGCREVETAQSLCTGTPCPSKNQGGVAVCVQGSMIGRSDEHGPQGSGSESIIRQSHTVRRLTPTECERLQGFPDFWTATGHYGQDISDTQRYKALGNSVAIPCVEYVLQGIAEELRNEQGDSDE